MSSRSLTKEKSDKSLVKTGYSSPGKRGNSTGGSIDTSSGKAESELARKSSERSLTRGDSKKNFNADGTSAREFNRDGSLRSIAKDKNSSSSVGNEAESPPKASKSSSKKDIVAISDVDTMIKQVSTKDMILSGEIDAFISDIEKKLSGDEGKSKSPPRKTVKNASLRSMLLDGTHDFDRYGFLITKPDSEAFVLSTDELQKRLDKEDERTDKWIYMLNHWDYFFLKKFNKIKSRVRKGIPHAIRGEAWHRLAHVDDMKVLFPLALDLDNLEERLDPHVVDEIGRDINRTFPSHRLFQEGGPGQEALRRVLQRYAILDPAIGYCQGMGFLAALLLQYLHEHDAFYALVSLMNRPSLPFRGMYSPGMEDTKKTLSVFAILAEVKVPKVWKHLVQQGIHHSMFVTSWIMTVFVSSFHFEFAARVWDALWVEGWKVVYKVCLGLLKYAEDELLTCNMEEIMMYFRKMPERMDPDLVWKYVWDVKVSQQEILRCEQWYHEEGGTQ